MSYNSSTANKYFQRDSLTPPINKTTCLLLRDYNASKPSTAAVWVFEFIPHKPSSACFSNHRWEQPCTSQAAWTTTSVSVQCYRYAALSDGGVRWVWCWHRFTKPFLKTSQRWHAEKRAHASTNRVCLFHPHSSEANNATWHALSEHRINDKVAMGLREAWLYQPSALTPRLQTTLIAWNKFCTLLTEQSKDKFLISVP